MTADETLKKYEDANEMHFYEVDRKWIIEAMKEYNENCIKENIQQKKCSDCADYSGNTNFEPCKSCMIPTKMIKLNWRAKK